MKIGLVKANFPGERRVPLLPKDIKDFKNEILVEEGFGKFLDIDDQEYIDKGCHILSRAEVFSESEAIFSLKLIQPTDYPYLREGQMIIGWTHPFGSGRLFMKEQALPKKLIVVDLDSNSPCIYYENEIFESGIPKGLLYKNSFYAGYAGVLDALLQYGFIPTEETMSIFKENYTKYDIIINGIEIGKEDDPILSFSEQKSLKKGTFIIDVAADAGNTIEGTHFTSMDDPIYENDGKYYYVVPNTPSLIYRNVSQDLSKILSENIFSEDCSRFLSIKS